MKKLVFSILLPIACLLMTEGAVAQRPTDRERQTWMKEMQQYKNDYLAKRLELTDEQKTEFLPLYNSMDEQIRKAQDETEQLYKQTMRKGDKATDIECEKAAEAIYELKGRENEIEMKYFNNFKSILTPMQLFKLKVVERDFTRELMLQHRRQKTK
ncbi:MAG: hypothetical protein NC127_09700 [Muribaculum sp.]|nr:hypothetical protein [Muribaculum sp.]